MYAQWSVFLLLSCVSQYWSSHKLHLCNLDNQQVTTLLNKFLSSPWRIQQALHPTIAWFHVSENQRCAVMGKLSWSYRKKMHSIAPTHKPHPWEGVSNVSTGTDRLPMI